MVLLRKCNIGFLLIVNKDTAKMYMKYLLRAVKEGLK